VSALLLAAVVSVMLGAGGFAEMGNGMRIRRRPRGREGKREKKMGEKPAHRASDYFETGTASVRR
jgi:hypothetical protein